MNQKFQKINPLNQVAEFHQTFGHPVLENPQLIDEKRSSLRVELLQEELNEFKQAIADGNIVEIADSLADLQYVLSGAVLEFGLGKLFPTIFDEVQRSNMSKACKTGEEAQQTQDKYLESEIATIAEEKGNYWVVTRADDNKILKSINYSEARISEIIHESKEEFYKTKVRKEKQDLDIDISNLNKFIDSNPNFKSMDLADQALYRNQLKAMNEYSSILQLRISKF